MKHLVAVLVEIVDGVANVGAATAKVNYSVPVAAVRNAHDRREAFEKAAEVPKRPSPPIQRVVVVIHHEDVALMVAVHANPASGIKPFSGVNMLHAASP